MDYCELCSGTVELTSFVVEPSYKPFLDNKVIICGTCRSGITDLSTVDTNHWRCLSESMWSDRDTVKVLTWRLLTDLKSEGWPLELLDQMYLETEALEWAKMGLKTSDISDETVPTRDSNGTQLFEGDSVTLIKDLEVKGAGFTAKRGTLVKNISLTSNPKHIEGRVNGIQIVLVAEYLKKA